MWKWDWVEGKHLSVDGSFVEANAAKQSRIPREQLGAAAQNPVEEPVHRQAHVSTTDPDSTYATKGELLQVLTHDVLDLVSALVSCRL